VRAHVKSVLSVALFTAVVVGGVARADVIPYPNAGTANPIIYNFTADYTGEIFAYFYTSSASYNETIGLLVNGVSTGILGLPNHGSAFGQKLDLGHASAGDTLVFSLHVSTTSDIFYSNPALNTDGSFNHVYATPYSGGGGIPAGTFVAFEDLRDGGDRDYNDTSFVFSSGVPEASTWAMMLVGFACMGFAAFRSRSRGEVLKTGVLNATA
jgi:Domain of unknown function (DUF4114)